MQVQRQKSTKPQFKDFESVDREPIYLATTNGGHTACVLEEPTPLHPIFHRVAMAEGAVPAGMRDAALATQEMNTNTQSMTREDIIIAACESVLKRADANPDQGPMLLLGDGRPDVEAVNKEAGIKITAAERDVAWAKLQDEG